MKEIQKYTAIIPIIGKTDTCTIEEVLKYKNIIISQLKEADIEIFCYDENLSTKNDFSSPLGECPPFSVISGVSRINTGNRFCYGRKYLWGFCDISNPFHSDFPVLSKNIIGKFYYPVKKITKGKAEKNYREWLARREKRKKMEREKICNNKIKQMEQITKFISSMALGILSLIRK